MMQIMLVWFSPCFTTGLSFYLSTLGKSVTVDYIWCFYGKLKSKEHSFVSHCVMFFKEQS